MHWIYMGWIARSGDRNSAMLAIVWPNLKNRVSVGQKASKLPGDVYKFWCAAAPNLKEAKMPLVQAEHPIIWEVTHHPLIVLVLALVVVAVVVWLVFGNFLPGHVPLTDINFAA